jgi:predicted transcriptional regulator
MLHVTQIRRAPAGRAIGVVDILGAQIVDCLPMSTTIRVSEQTRDRFAQLADATGRPMTQLLDEAADALERRVFFDRFSARYDELRADPAAWDEIESERLTESGAVRDSSS